MWCWLQSVSQLPSGTKSFSRSLFREEKFQVKPLGPGYQPTRYSSTFIITEMSLPFSLAKNESYSTTVPTSNNMDCPICNYWKQHIVNIITTIIIIFNSYYIQFRQHLSDHVDWKCMLWCHFFRVKCFLLPFSIPRKKVNKIHCVQLTNRTQLNCYHELERCPYTFPL